MRIVYVIERLSGTGGLQRILTEKMNYLAEHTAHEVVLMTVWHDDRALPYTISPQVRRIRLNVPPTPAPRYKQIQQIHQTCKSGCHYILPRGRSIAGRLHNVEGKEDI